MKYPEARKEFGWSAKYIIEGNLLDVGCGYGVFSEFIQSATDYLGIDANIVSVQRGVSLGGDIKHMSIELISLD
jgi:2-polyprenyl-3-methyl-5-hydroxy-6-metoxy-1,4-benzoquinol methylase